MPRGFNPYGNIQPQLEQYDVQRSLQNVARQGLLGTKWQQGKYAKHIEKKVSKIEKDLARRRKRAGVLGGLFSLGSMFIPGMGLWGKSLLSGLISGGSQAGTKRWTKKAREDIERLQQGTFADKGLKELQKGYTKNIKELDPLKAAVESAALTFAMGSVGDKVKGTEGVKDTSVSADPTIQKGAITDIKLGGTDISTLDVPKDVPIDLPKDLPKDLATQKLPFGRQYGDIKNPAMQQIMKPFASDKFLKEASASWSPFLTQYMSGATSGMGGQPITDNLQMILDMIGKR